MKHLIDPTVDCVFKAILGDPANVLALTNFLEAILRPASPIVGVTIVNPYNERDFEGQRLTVVDIKARDAAEVTYQVEIQLASHTALAERMLYTWASVYTHGFTAGQKYEELRPAVSIWLLTGRIFEDTAFHHRFQPWDVAAGMALSDQMEIHVLELSKWRPAGTLDDEGRWMYFFKEGRRWSSLPPHLETPSLRLAMSVLHRFSEQEEDYERYRARMDFLSVQATIKAEHDRTVAALEKAEAELVKVKADAELSKMEAEKAKMEAKKAKAEGELAKAEGELAKAEGELAKVEAEKEKAEATNERLRARLRSLGVDPDA